MKAKNKKLRWHWRGTRPGQSLAFVLDDRKVHMVAPSVIELSPGEIEMANLMDLVDKGTLSLEAGPPVRRSRRKQWDEVYNWDAPNEPAVERIVR